MYLPFANTVNPNSTAEADHLFSIILYQSQIGLNMYCYLHIHIYPLWENYKSAAGTPPNCPRLLSRHHISRLNNPYTRKADRYITLPDPPILLLVARNYYKVFQVDYSGIKSQFRCSAFPHHGNYVHSMSVLLLSQNHSHKKWYLQPAQHLSIGNSCF